MSESMKESPNIISDVVERHLCTGCGVCSFISEGAYQMVDIEDIGKRPRQVAPVSNESECLRACPGIGLSHTNLSSSEDYDRDLLRDWGPVRFVWEGYATDRSIRHKASSGGATTAIAKYCLEVLGFEGVLHTGAREDKPYLNETVFSRSAAELEARTGSRYAPSSPCEGLELIKSASRECVFIGKPCDVAGTNQAALGDKILKERLGLTIAFVCAGTPSTKGTLELLKRCGVENTEDVESVRYRGLGWPGNWRVQSRNESGKLQLSQLSYEDSWGFLQQYRQWRCYICPDHTGEFADITVGDPWWRDVGDNEEGLSLIVARTARGEEVLRDAVDKGYIAITAIESSMLPLSQKNILTTRAHIWGRLMALYLARCGVPKFSGFNLLELWKEHLSFKDKVKSILSTFKRIWVKHLFRRQKLSR
jgi:coenzyme F420 hydrogenase subunit beta